MNEKMKHKPPSLNGNQERFKIPVQPRAIEQIELGRIEQVHLHSTLGPFAFAPECITTLTSTVIDAIGQLVAENAQVSQLFVSRNTEGDPLAYQHCVMPNGVISEPFFQVDMVATEENLITASEQLDTSTVAEHLRCTIFEFEPSLAMYELIGTFGSGGMLGENLRQHLDLLRWRHGKPIAILAPTQEKFAAVLATEFGLPLDHGLSPAELAEHVQAVSGFDTVLGPEDFMQHMIDTDGHCHFLLFVRPSDPIAKLRDPHVALEHPLLGHDLLRKIIRRNAITLNIDNPEWSATDPRRIKDSKAALPLMNMGLRVRSQDDVGELLNGKKSLWRAKPRAGVFGAYGQKIIDPANDAHRQWLGEQLSQRGPYVLQPEMAPLMVIDQSSGQKFLAMDRNFFSMVTGVPEFLGGLRILIPVESMEAKNGRLHGSRDMITVPIMAT